MQNNHVRIVASVQFAVLAALGACTSSSGAAATDDAAGTGASRGETAGHESETATGSNTDSGSTDATSGPTTDDSGGTTTGDTGGGPDGPSGTRARGYQARGCGLDLDDDGVLGEPEDCSLCDGVTTDPDGDGTDEDLIYVDCDSGADDPNCGSPSTPCATLEHAFNVRADGPADGAEDIVCFRGTCTPDNLRPETSGVPGSVTRDATGTEVRAFEFPRDPAMLVGWDSDADGEYPPNDPDDTAVLDGSGLSQAFELNAGGNNNSYFEMAHFLVRNYGVGATDGTGAFMKVDFVGGDDASHIHMHDLRFENMNKGRFACSRCSLWNMFHAAGLTFFAVTNIESLDQATYVARGAPSETAGPPEAGPWRFQNITATFHGCDASGPEACDRATDAHATGWKLWGYVTGVEILDSRLFAQPEDWEPNPGPGGAPGANGVVVAQCARDFAIRNSEFHDFVSALVVQGSASGFCDERTVDDVWFDRNRVLNTSPWTAARMIRFSTGDTIRSTSEDVTLTNNFLWSAPEFGHCLYYDTGNGDGPQPGTITFSGNTCHGSTASFGSIFLTDRTSFRHEDFVIQSNIFSGIEDGEVAIQTRYAPAGWVADGNVYAPGATFVWSGNNNPKVDLPDFQAATQQDAGSTACAPVFVDEATGDLHLAEQDSCATAAGVELDAVIEDIDGEARQGAAGWPAGADTP